MDRHVFPDGVTCSGCGCIKYLARFYIEGTEIEVPVTCSRAKAQIDAYRSAQTGKP